MTVSHSGKGSLPVRRPTALLALAAVGAIVGSTLITAPAEARPWRGHPGRSIVTHVVRPGDTATELAVRYHAWTDELIALHHHSSVLVVGERIRIPVVTAAVRKAQKTRAHHVVRHHATRHHHKRAHAKVHRQPRHHRHLTRHEKAMRAHGWRHWQMSRTQV